MRQSPGRVPLLAGQLPGTRHNAPEHRIDNPLNLLLKIMASDHSAALRVAAKEPRTSATIGARGQAVSGEALWPHQAVCERINGQTSHRKTQPWQRVPDARRGLVR